MEWKSYRIHAHDEVTRIGCGHRTVLARVGRKWVRVKSRVDPQVGTACPYQSLEQDRNQGVTQ